MIPADKHEASTAPSSNHLAVHSFNDIHLPFRHKQMLYAFQDNLLTLLNIIYRRDKKELDRLFEPIDRTNQDT